MIQNYLTIAWRNLMKNKVFSFINIFGLSVGLTCCLLISLYIAHEVSYDKHHQNGDRLYQLGTLFIDQGVENRGGNTSGPLGSMLQQEYPEVTASTRILSLFRDDKTLLQVKGADGSLKSFYEKKGFLADSNFFQIINYTFKEGTPLTALTEPNSVVLSEEIALKLFGKQPAINKTIRVSSSTNGDSTFRVTGVLAAPTSPSHLDANFFISFRGGYMDGMANNNPSLMNNNMFSTYVLLKEGADAKNLQQKFPGFVQRHLGEELKQMARQRNYFLTPIADIHLAGFQKGSTEGGNKTTLFILGSIAVLTLLIACINFMNLSTANSAKRAAEVGVRKVLGARKSSLLRQFLGESLVMAGIAFLFALLLTFLLLPLFEKVAGKTLIIPLQQKFFWVGPLFCLPC